MSAFSATAPDFDAFLAKAKDNPGLAPKRAGDSRNTRFIPRNFLIEERIDATRASAYATAFPSALAADPAEAFEQWNEVHNIYVLERIFVRPPAGHDHHSVDTNNPTTCPETFRSSLALAFFQGTDLDTHFIRLMPVSDIAWLAREREDRILALGEQFLQDPSPRNPARDELAYIFDEAFLGPNCDHRPVFAAFYEDFLEDLDDPTDPSWPNRVRDRLGLFHLNQWTRPFPRPVFLFRYSARELPRRRGEVDRRPIALPAVLDHRLSEAFCPAPRELNRGQLLNLQENSTSEPAREIVHLFMPFEPKHLFRVGMITSPAPEYLGSARRDHLLWLRLRSDRDDYGAETDGDLF